jgi:hypothetical protein
MNLNDLKNWMWIEVCEGNSGIEMSDEYKELVSDIGDENVNGGLFIWYFYLILGRLIKDKLIEFCGGDFDWILSYLDEYNEGINFDNYINDYYKLLVEK